MSRIVQYPNTKIDLILTPIYMFIIIYYDTHCKESQAFSWMPFYAASNTYGRKQSEAVE